MNSYRTIWLATLLFFGGFYALLVPLPRYLAEIGLNDWQIGLVLGTFGIASLICRPLAGVAADALGTRPVLLFGTAALFIGALGVLTTQNLALLMLLRFLQAVGYVAFTTAGTALVVAITPTEQRPQRLAIFGIAANLAITLTPALMSAALAVLPLAAGFVISAGIALFAGMLTWGVGKKSEVRSQKSEAPAPLKESSPHSAHTSSRFSVLGSRFSVLGSWFSVLGSQFSVLGSWFSVPRLPSSQVPRFSALRSPFYVLRSTLWLPMLLSGLFGACFAAFFQFAPILAERRGDIDAGWLYAAYGVGIIATRLLSRPLLDRLDTPQLLFGAACVTALGLGLIALGPPLPWIFLAVLLIAAGSGTNHPVLIAHHAALLPHAPGQATAAFYLGFDLGIGLGSWLFGVLLQFTGIVGLYAGAAVLAVLVLPCLPLLRTDRALSSSL